MTIDKETLIVWAVWAFFIAGVIGWIANIVQLADMCCGMSGMMILRAVGILVPPLGAVLGFV